MRILNFCEHHGYVCTRTGTSMRAVRGLGRNLCGLLLGVWVSTSCLQADVCSEARDAMQRRDLSSAEGLLKQCAAANPTQLGPVLDLCGVYQAQGRGEDLVRTASRQSQLSPATATTTRCCILLPPRCRCFRHCMGNSPTIRGATSCQFPGPSTIMSRLQPMHR